MVVTWQLNLRAAKMTAETTLTQSNGQSTPVTNGVVIQNESSSLPVPNGVINEDEQEGAESDSSEATSQDPKANTVVFRFFI